MAIPMLWPLSGRITDITDNQQNKEKIKQILYDGIDKIQYLIEKTKDPRPH